jgi:Eph receptor B1
VTISGLNPVTTYRFQVFADNGVSDQVPLAEHQYIDIAVTTEASVPSSVSNVRVSNVRSTEVTLRWDAPDDPYSDIEMYEVRYFMKGFENNASSVLINRPESAFSNLRQQTVYGFQVRAKTTHGWGEFSLPVYKTTGTVLGKNHLEHLAWNPLLTHFVDLSAAYEHTEENLQVRIIAGAVVAGVILVAIIAVVTVLYLRRYNLVCT